MSDWQQQLSDEFDRTVARVRTNDSVQDLELKYHGLPERDRLALNTLAVVVGVFLLYQLILSPAIDYLKSASANYQTQLESHEWMVVKEPEAKALISGGEEGGLEGSLLSVASSTAKNYELTFSRFEPMGDEKVRLWLEQVKFNSVVSWLGELETKKGVSAVDISLDSSIPGYVSVRLTLQG